MSESLENNKNIEDEDADDYSVYEDSPEETDEAEDESDDYSVYEDESEDSTEDDEEVDDYSDNK